MGSRSGKEDRRNAPADRSRRKRDREQVPIIDLVEIRKETFTDIIGIKAKTRRLGLRFVLEKLYLIL